MKVLVTGAEGFIGKYVAEYFVVQGHNVYGWDIFPAVYENYEVKDVNLLHEDVTSKLLEVMPDVVVHCMGCANVGQSLQTPLDDFSGNTIAVYRLLEGIRVANVKKCKFIMLSSAGVYGQPDKLPIIENTVLKPMSPYALHKKLAEEICEYYMLHYNIKCNVARIFSAYGVGLKKQIFWDMYKKVMTTGKLEMFGTGNESRDFIHIVDLVKAIYLIAISVDAPFCINVANGKETTIRVIAEKFARYYGIKDIMFNGIVKEGDPKNWCADISVLESLGYKQEIDIDLGISQYVEWVKGLN